MGFGTGVNKCYDCGEKYRINDGHICRNSKSNSNNSDEDLF